MDVRLDERPVAVAVPCRSGWSLLAQRFGMNGWDLAAACVLANLWFPLKAWAELRFLHAASDRYFGHGDLRTMEEATILNVVLLTGTLWLAFHLIRRYSKRTPAVAMVLCLCFILVRMIIDPLRMRAIVGEDGLAAIMRGLGPIGFAAAVFVVIGCSCFFALSRPVRFAQVVGLLWPFALLNIGDAAWFHFREWRYSAQPAPKLAARLHAGDHSSDRVRVLWLIYDELDQDLAFDHRPQGLDLPAFDRFRAHALAAGQAHSPAGDTMEAIPALFMGTAPVKVANPRGRNLIDVSSGGRSVSWQDAPNIIKAARGLNFNVGLAGWFHPYCGLFGSWLVECFDYQVPTASQAVPDMGVVEMATSQFLRESNMLPVFRRFDGRVFDSYDVKCVVKLRAKMMNAFTAVLPKALAQIADPTLDLALVHLPTPHPFGIFNRRTLRPEESGNYLDNLVLADATLDRILRTLENARLSDRTVIVLSSDHAFRRRIWGERSAWTSEMEAATSRSDLSRVPFLVKMPHQDRPVTFDSPFNTVLTKDLVLALLRRRVTSVEDLTGWLNSHIGAAQAPTFNRGR